MRQNPLLSLVITSYTTERLHDIYELFDSIKNQTYKNIEVVFVAERTRELYEKVKMYAAEKGINNFNAIFNDGKPGQSPARNLGVKHAKGDIIAFVDDDVILFDDWGMEMVKTYDNNSYIGVTGPAFPLWEDESMKWLPIEFYWITSCTDFAGLTEPTAVRTCGGMNMSFLREAFDYCQFSQDFGHIAKEQKKVGPVVDDAEFSINLRIKTGKLILFNPLVRVKHRVYAYRLGGKFIRGQAFWQGYSKSLLKKVYKNDPDTQALVKEKTLLSHILFKLSPQIALQFFSHPKLAWKKMALTTSVLFYITLGYSAYSYPRLMGFTKRYFSS